MDCALPMNFIMDRRAELFHGSCTISGVFVDPMNSPELIREASFMRGVFPGIERSALWEFVSSSFRGDTAQKEEGKRTL